MGNGGWGLGLVLFLGLVERWEWRDLNIGGEDGCWAGNMSERGKEREVKCGCGF
jgi:hypothetical protein